jgi:hypothetical protein
MDKLKTVPEAAMNKRQAIAMLNQMSRCERPGGASERDAGR